MKREESARRAHCPQCGSAIAWRGNPHRPFCSLSGPLIDLGGWLDERYRVPGPELPRESTADDAAPHGDG